MISRFPKLESAIYRAYAWFFRTPPTPEVKRFIRNLGWIFIGTLVAKAILFIINVVGGRILGEATYGRFTLIVSIANFMIIPILIAASGSITKYISEAVTSSKRRRTVSTITWFTAGSLVVWSIVYLLIASLLAGIIRTSSGTVLMAVAFSAAWVVWSFTENTLIALQQARRASIIMIIAYIVMAVLFAIVLFSLPASLLLLYLPFMANYIVFGTLGLRHLFQWIRLKIDRVILKRVLTYGFYSTVILVASTFFGNIDRLMLNRYLGESAVGIYQAYYLGSITLVGILTGIFVKVFVPSIARFKSKKTILERLNRMLLPAEAILLLLPVVIYIVIRLYGFPVLWSLILLFTLATMLDVVAVIYGSLFNILSIRSVRKTSIAMTISFILNIAVNLVLIPTLGIQGAVIATIISLAWMAGFLLFSLKKEIG